MRLCSWMHGGVVGPLAVAERDLAAGEVAEELLPFLAGRRYSPLGVVRACGADPGRPEPPVPGPAGPGARGLRPAGRRRGAAVVVPGVGGPGTAVGAVAAGGRDSYVLFAAVVLLLSACAMLTPPRAPWASPPGPSLATAGQVAGDAGLAPR